MLYPSINKIRKKADSRYTLVILAAKRARDIVDGKPALTEDSVNRPVSIAASEIAEDLITYNRGEKAPVTKMSEEAEAVAEGIADEVPAETLEEISEEKVDQVAETGEEPEETPEAAEEEPGEE